MVIADNTFVQAPLLDLNGGSQVANYFPGQVNASLLPAFQYGLGCNNDINIPDNSAPVTLALSCYGKIEIGKNVTVTFSGSGTVNVEEMDIKEGASIYFNQDTDLLIEKDFKGGKEMILSDNGHRVWIYAKKKVKIEESSDVSCNIYTLKNLEVEKGAEFATTMTGLFISADKIDAKENVIWNWSQGCEVETGGSGSLVIQNENQETVIPEASQLKASTNLSAYPNPFAEQTTIQFELTEAAAVTLEVYNLQGQRLRQFIHDQLEAGPYARQWDGRAENGQPLDAGIYFIRLRAGKQVLTTKVSLMKM